MEIVTFSEGTLNCFFERASAVREGNRDILQTNCFSKIVISGQEQQPKEWWLDAKGTKAWGHRQIDEYSIDCILQDK